MAIVAPKAYINKQIVDVTEAQVSVASSAVLYGLSVYSVFFLKVSNGQNLAFRLNDHYQRLVNSSRMIGMDSFEQFMSFDEFQKVIKEVVAANQPSEDQFVRVTYHAVQEVAGVRTAGLKGDLSIFLYKAENILPQGVFDMSGESGSSDTSQKRRSDFSAGDVDASTSSSDKIAPTSTEEASSKSDSPIKPNGARLKTSLWRRTADTAIPARAKVNGAYVNSCLAKQEAIENGYDDCLFLNKDGFVSELSAANIFIVRDGVLITPDVSSDILEGITRKSVIELAQKQGLEVQQRKVALTEVYNAQEVFACGTSAFVSPIIEVDARQIGDGQPGKITHILRDQLAEIQSNSDHTWTTNI